jgi:hypothetical protein
MDKTPVILVREFIIHDRDGEKIIPSKFDIVIKGAFCFSDEVELEEFKEALKNCFSSQIKNLQVYC